VKLEKLDSEIASLFCPAVRDPEKRHGSNHGKGILN
jgi:hypothetical protein